MKIEAVTFDVGGTLIQPWPSVGQVYAEVAARHGLRDISAERLNASFKTAWRARIHFDYSRAAWAELVDQVFAEAGATSSVKAIFPELYDHFAEAKPWRVFEDVRPTLEALAGRDVRLGVISNWDDRLRPLLRRLELDRYFETTVVSCEVGFAKPSPVIFEQAAQKLGMPPAAILHVGDSFEMDVEGACAAGFHGLQVQRGDGAGDARQITSLAELLARIGNPISPR